MSITYEQLKKVSPNVNKDYIEAINAGFTQYKITDKNTKAAILANLLHESNSFNAVTENLNYRAETLLKVFPNRFKTLNDAKVVVAGGQESIGNKIYGGRMGNNDKEGYLYRGRGLIQITGKANYTMIGKELGIDLINNPGLLTIPTYAVNSALIFLIKNNCINTFKVKGFDALCIAINGGKNGLEDRRAKYAALLKVLV